MAALSVGHQDRRIRTQGVRVAALFRITVAGFCMDEDRSGQGDEIRVAKGIIGEERSLLRSDLKDLEAVPARTVSGSDLDVHGVSVARRSAGRAHGIRYLGRDGNNPQLVHGLDSLAAFGLVSPPTPLLLPAGRCC